MQLFSANATIFKKKTIGPQNVEKPTIKICPEKKTNTLFFLTAWAAQTAQTEEFMFQIVAYRPTVYRTGTAPLLILGHLEDQRN